MRYFPLFLDLSGKPVLVIGGGEVASRKVEALLKADACVTIIAPDITPFLHNLVDTGQCQWQNTTYLADYLTPEWVQVWATTDNNILNHQIYRDAKRHNILVNVVDDLPFCDFITPAMVNRGRIQIAISSGGASPVLIRNIRESIESVLPLNTDLLAEFASSKRDDIKNKFPSVDRRRQFWEAYFADFRVKSATQVAQLDDLYRLYCQKNTQRGAQELWVLADEVELLPIKALRYMQQAQVILYPQEQYVEYLELCRRDAERQIYRDPETFERQLIQLRQTECQMVVIIGRDNQDDWQRQGNGHPLISGGREWRA